LTVVSFLALADAATAIAKVIDRSDSSLQPRLSEQWREELLQGFLRGELRMFYTSDRRPIHPDSPGAMVGALTTGAVTLRELNRWLAVIGTDLVVTESNLMADAKRKRLASTDVEVRQSARRMADDWSRDYFDRTGDIPPIDRVAKEIRSGLSHQFNWDWEESTIRRHCLAGWQFSPMVHSAQIAQD
jgi:hypothetical protein